MRIGMFKKNQSLALLFFTHVIFGSENLPVIRLAPPRIEQEYIDKHVTCIRPGRNGRFNLAAEIKDNTLLVHNYGASGAGWTLLFGLVQESINQLESMIEKNPIYQNQPVCVIGAGCMGLLTAILLQERGYNVRIVAEQIEDLTSHTAGGFFSGNSSLKNAKTVQEKNFVGNVWIESYNFYKSIAQGLHPLFSKDCARFIPYFVGKNTESYIEFYVGLGLMQPPLPVIIDFGTGTQREMKQYSTFFIDVLKMMERMHDLIDQKNIDIQQQFVASFDDVPESIIFNCSGLGSKELAGDDQVLPVQGHLIMLKNQPTLEYVIYEEFESVDQNGNVIEDYFYYIPKEQGLLGGTFIKHEGSLTSNHHEFARILDRAADYFGVK